MRARTNFSSFRSQRLLPSVLAVAALLATARPAAAETLPTFHLSGCTDAAVAVVRGQLAKDGTLVVTGVLRGEVEPGKAIRLRGGDSTFRELKQAAKAATPGSFDVVVYVSVLKDDEGYPIWGSAGVVGFRGEDVFLHLGEEEGALLRRGGGWMQRHPKHTPESFLLAARNAIVAADRRKELLAMKSSPERGRQLFAFLKGLPESAQAYHLSHAVRDLAPLPRDEESALLDLFHEARDESDRMLLLHLIAGAARSRSAFREVAAWLDRDRPAAMRRAAIHALDRIDPFAAQATLAGLLRRDEPELPSVLSALRGTDPNRLDPRVLGPLLELTADVRDLHRQVGRQVRFQESHLLVEVLGHFAHPRTAAALAEWALADDHDTAGYACRQLEEAAGLLRLTPADRADRVSLAAWWKTAKPALAGQHDLKTEAGRRAWYAAMRKADESARRILVCLWRFEAEPDTVALIREAKGDDAAPAKAALAELWRGGRLSADARRAVVRAFVTVRLEELTDVHRDPTVRELRIVGERNFPFPANTWVDCRAAIALGGKGPILPGTPPSTINFQGSGPIVLGTLGGGSHPGSPVARAAVSVAEIDRQTKDKHVVWESRWDLGPITMRAAPKPKDN